MPRIISEMLSFYGAGIAVMFIVLHFYIRYFVNR